MPKRRQPKQCMSVAVLACRRFGYNQNGDKSKTVTIQLIQNAVLTCIQNGEKNYVSPFLICRRFGVPPFWIYNQNGDKSKTATTKTATIQLYLFTKLISIQHGYIPKRCLSPFWICRRFGVSPFWIQPKRRQIQNGDNPTLLYFLYVALCAVLFFISYMIIAF